MIIMPTYRDQSTSRAGFLRMVTANYLPKGCVYYSHGYFRDEAQARRAELNIVCRYDLAISKNRRYRRRLAGLANVQFLRYRLGYLFLATEGTHPLKLVVPARLHTKNVSDALSVLRLSLLS
jgi:hypothetical protein